jgi:hypothetical protein
MLAWCFFLSHRYHPRRRRRHHHIAQTITTESSEQILEDRFFDHLKDWVLRAGSRRQASLRKTDAVGVRENLSSGPAKPGKPFREWIRIHSGRLFLSRSTRFCSYFSFFFTNLI